jgi:myo-inositol-1(or 4)-monophosphatase
MGRGLTGAELDGLLDLACRAARAGGERAAEGRRGGLQVTTKSSITDLVTVHDRAAEAAIVATLTAARPDDAIVGEEGTNRPGPSGVAWYLDPIDGTTNFVYDVPAWATSVGAGDADGMLVGAVYVPVLDELFAAARGRGATLNGRPIRCSDTDELALALVATGFGYTPERRHRQAAIVTELVASIRDIRRLGAAALDLCYVAAGRFDAYFEEHLNIWDIAAGELIAREAGCRTGDFAGGPATPAQIAVAAPGVFDRLVDALPSG